MNPSPVCHMLHQDDREDPCFVKNCKPAEGGINLAKRRINQMNQTLKFHLKTFSIPQTNVAQGEPLSDPESAAKVFRSVFSSFDLDVENFAVLAQDARGKIKGFKHIAKGTATACLVHPREIFRAGLFLGACSILIGHNHPSGDPMPSDEDIKLTQRMFQSGKILGIPVVDHIILGHSSFVSLMSIRPWLFED